MSDGQRLLPVTYKKVGIAGPSIDLAKTAQQQKIKKDTRSRQPICDAVMENDFMKHLWSSQVKAIVDVVLKVYHRCNLPKLPTGFSLLDDDRSRSTRSQNAASHSCS